MKIELVIDALRDAGIKYDSCGITRDDGDSSIIYTITNGNKFVAIEHWEDDTIVVLKDANGENRHLLEIEPSALDILPTAIKAVKEHLGL